MGVVLVRVVRLHTVLSIYLYINICVYIYRILYIYIYICRVYKHTDTLPLLKLVVMSVSVKARLAIKNQSVARRPS